MPTSSPTESDTVKIFVSFGLEAIAPPNVTKGHDFVALRTAVGNVTGLPQSDLTGFEIDSKPFQVNERRLGSDANHAEDEEEGYDWGAGWGEPSEAFSEAAPLDEGDVPEDGAPDTRDLVIVTKYRWSVEFVVVSSLNATVFKDEASYEARVTSGLSSPKFTTALRAYGAKTVTTRGGADRLNVYASTRAPTIAPSPLPTRSDEPTPDPTPLAIPPVVVAASWESSVLAMVLGAIAGALLFTAVLEGARAYRHKKYNKPHPYATVRHGQLYDVERGGSLYGKAKGGGGFFARLFGGGDDGFADDLSVEYDLLEEKIVPPKIAASDLSLNPDPFWTNPDGRCHVLKGR